MQGGFNGGCEMICAGSGTWVVRCVGSPMFRITGEMGDIIGKVLKVSGRISEAMSMWPYAPGKICESLGKLFKAWGICVGHGKL